MCYSVIQCRHFGSHAYADLQDLSEAEQARVLKQAGLIEPEVEEAITFLTAFPHLALAARCEVDGEEDIREQDPVKCRVRGCGGRSEGCVCGGGGRGRGEC